MSNLLGVGDVVSYVPAAHDGLKHHHPHRMAVITTVVGEHKLDLQISRISEVDHEKHTFHRTNVEYSAKKEPGTWHYASK